MLSPEELRLLERKRDVDLDAIYGSGTVALSRNMKCLVLLKWRLKEEAFVVRRLRPPEALLELPCTTSGRSTEVSGGVDFPSLVRLVGDVLAT